MIKKCWSKIVKKVIQYAIGSLFLLGGSLAEKLASAKNDYKSARYNSRISNLYILSVNGLRLGYVNLTTFLAAVASLVILTS